MEPSRAGLGLCAFVFAVLEPRADAVAFVGTLQALPEALEAHHATGPHSRLLKARVADAAALQRLMMQGIKPLPGVLRIGTVVALHTAKETTELALPAAPAPAVRAGGGR